MLTDAPSKPEAAESDPHHEWITLETDGSDIRVRVSGEYVRLERHLVPTGLEIMTGGDGEPEIYARIKVTEHRSRLVELRLTATDPDTAGIEQAHLRAIEVAALLTDFVALFSTGWALIPYHSEHRADGAVALELIGAVEDGRLDPEFAKMARRLHHRGPRNRRLTPALLKKVAEIYRANIDGYPTAAIRHYYQVPQRTAAYYVQRARKAGLLPPTVQGRKQA